jgi:hypothetical protein
MLLNISQTSQSGRLVIRKPQTDVGLRMKMKEARNNLIRECLRSELKNAFDELRKISERFTPEQVKKIINRPIIVDMGMGLGINNFNVLNLVVSRKPVQNQEDHFIALVSKLIELGSDMKTDSEEQSSTFNYLSMLMPLTITPVEGNKTKTSLAGFSSKLYFALVSLTNDLPELEKFLEEHLKGKQYSSAIPIPTEAEIPRRGWFTCIFG